MDKELFLEELARRIANAKKAIAESKEELEKAKLAGLDMSEEEEKLREDEMKLRRLEEVYFPKKTTKK